MGDILLAVCVPRRGDVGGYQVAVDTERNPAAPCTFAWLEVS